MRHKPLRDLAIAILATDGFEESELSKPHKALLATGATVHIISPKGTKIKSWKAGNWSKAYKVDKLLSKVNANEYDALVLPGGVINPDTLRTNKDAIKFVKAFLSKNKLVAAICHGPLTLVETKKLTDRKLTSYHSIKTDLKNAGAHWQNKAVVVDKNLITSRKPDDIPAFNKAIIAALQQLV